MPYIHLPGHAITLLSLLDASIPLADHTVQLVHVAEEQVTLLEELLIDGRLVLRRQLVGRDDAADLVDGASDTTARDEPREITGKVQSRHVQGPVDQHSPVNEGLADAERAAHALKRKAAVALEKLSVRLDAHLANVVAGVWGEEGVGDEVLLLDLGEGDEEGGITALVQ
jgi:hypothetical protein